MKYIVDDGTEFTSLEKAKAYEKKIGAKINRVKSMDISETLGINFSDFEEDTVLEDVVTVYAVKTESDRQALLSFITGEYSQEYRAVEDMQLPNFVLTDSEQIECGDDEIDGLVAIGTDIIKTLKEKLDVYDKLMQKVKG